MELSAYFYITAVVAVLITGASKSGFGGGLGVMAVPLMSLFVAPQFAAAVMMPLLLVMDLLIIWRYRHDWNRAVLLALLPGALIGLVVGALGFEHMQADAVRGLVGGLAAFFVLQYLLQGHSQNNPRKTPTLVVSLLGATSGFASYIAHAGGPPVKGYLLRQKFEKTEFVATNTIFFFILNALKTIAYGSTGALGQDSLMASLTLAPCLFVGVYFGARLHQIVDQVTFVKIVYICLMITAVKLLWDSLPNLLS